MYSAWFTKYLHTLRGYLWGGYNENTFQVSIYIYIIYVFIYLRYINVPRCDVLRLATPLGPELVGTRATLSESMHTNWGWSRVAQSELEWVQFTKRIWWNIHQQTERKRLLGWQTINTRDLRWPVTQATRYYQNTPHFAHSPTETRLMQYPHTPGVWQLEELCL